MSVSATTPTIVLVELQADDESDFITVWTHWADVDRTATHGFAVPNARLAQRLTDAIWAGAVFYDPEVRTNAAGQTYVDAHSRVLGKYLNADLKRLGF